MGGSGPTWRAVHAAPGHGVVVASPSGSSARPTARPPSSKRRATLTIQYLFVPELLRGFSLQPVDNCERGAPAAARRKPAHLDPQQYAGQA